MAEKCYYKKCESSAVIQWSADGNHTHIHLYIYYIDTEILVVIVCGGH